ncbi:MAG: TIGR02221 family CRISPR-associated protein [Planctomycetaceae bacterium]|jgi:CRISPR-associated DxTHG motif protein|nr:TIGR02221 family CRISPR-associated protein [Planctomycetaceae bacterium]
MSRNVFLSFLGTGNYTKCVYQSNDGRKSSCVRFVQSATLELFCYDWKEHDKRFIFTTEESKEKHWKQLHEESPLAEQIDIPEGKDETEIWRIFNILYESLQDGDELTIDITHSFRHIPLLASSLLQYAKFLKNVSVNKIYYGAFERLGKPHEVEQHILNPEERIVPVFDLTAFSEIQDWSAAANDFISFGNPSRLGALMQQHLSPVLFQTGGQDKTAQQLNKLNQKIKKFSQVIKTNRGQNIIEGRLQKEILEILSSLEQNLISALNPILKKMEISVKKTYQGDNNVRNMLAVVEWCLEKNLVQEGLTILQEGIISCLLSEKNYLDRNTRQFVSSCLQYCDSEKKIESKLSEDDQNCLKEHLHQQFGFKKLAGANGIFRKITELRNDINHSGMGNSAQPSDKFQKLLTEYFEEIKKIFVLFK